MHYNSIFISDIHLGTRGCKAEKLLSFLKDNDSEFLFLVGDIIDIWALKRKIYWPQSHNDIIQKILRKARKGTKVIYIPGNHDEIFRDFFDVELGNNIIMCNEFVHTTIDGKKLLGIHGDRFDDIISYNKNIALLGDVCYTLLLIVNDWHHYIKKLFGIKNRWSLSKFLKNKVKQSMKFISNYEFALSHECKLRNFDGIFCGHIHHPEIKEINGIMYYNCGDWVESCTALVEHFDGKIELVYGE